MAPEEWPVNKTVELFSKLLRRVTNGSSSRLKTCRYPVWHRLLEAPRPPSACRSTFPCKAVHQYSFRLRRPAVDVDYPLQELVRPRYSDDSDAPTTTDAVGARPHPLKCSAKLQFRRTSRCACIVRLLRATHRKTHQWPDGMIACRMSAFQTL